MTDEQRENENSKVGSKSFEPFHYLHIHFYYFQYGWTPSFTIADAMIDNETIAVSKGNSYVEAGLEMKPIEYMLLTDCGMEMELIVDEYYFRFDNRDYDQIYRL